MVGREEHSILTPINEPVVVLLISFLAVGSLVEGDGGNAFGLAVAVVSDDDFPNGADGLGEELLRLL
jgi:hypothetical protein